MLVLACLFTVMIISPVLSILPTSPGGPFPPSSLPPSPLSFPLSFPLSPLPPVSILDHYAILVSGSSSYSNYRHQADICHAKQLLLTYGVPRENIITFVFDDIAKDPSNPYPGLVFNAPSPLNVSGVDVYQGCVDERTYTGENITVANFIRALTGNATPGGGGGGPVLTSNPHSRLFINLVDHGGPGVFCFPEDELTANVLNASIATAYKAGLFGSLVLFVESCESGSLFDSILPTNASNFPVYVATASSPFESVSLFFMKARTQNRRRAHH